ncbi:hypothetical protein [Francisella philomiragia]|uniref:Uncharacterized protein n=1 Tax=Francisella philomiragia TaxID=28110 RepID=A0ABS1GCX3_9GAMM|nr:hypothetical protein [Francisella philomiragia]MBK2258983.1 hypothetical protein [Francisella philomiragia]MBK2302674.1 hypothetical protein [Francisella philomiragia]MBY7733492.1 hypothetical protein [Francisella philomiragia]
MSNKINSFIFGFVNAFRPVDYSHNKRYGSIANNVRNKINTNVESTRVEINKISKEEGISISYSR